MYGHQSLQNNLFLMLYGGIAMLALVAGLYLWLRRSNAITLDVNPPQALRQWTAAFLITAALSHVWWYVLGVYWLVDDRLVRNITAVMLDYITLVPLVIAMSHKCGFKSYSTFSVAFKQFKGQTVKAWMLSQTHDLQNLQ